MTRDEVLEIVRAEFKRRDSIEKEKADELHKLLAGFCSGQRGVEHPAPDWRLESNSTLPQGMVRAIKDGMRPLNPVADEILKSAGFSPNSGAQVGAMFDAAHKAMTETPFKDLLESLPVRGCESCPTPPSRAQIDQDSGCSGAVSIPDPASDPSKPPPDSCSGASGTGRAS